MQQVEIIDSTTRKSAGMHSFLVVPQKDDLVSIGGIFYKVVLRSHNLDENGNQNAFAIVVKKVDENGVPTQDSRIAELIKSIANFFK